jgi:hypothetical protein
LSTGVLFTAFWATGVCVSVCVVLVMFLILRHWSVLVGDLRILNHWSMLVIFLILRHGNGLVVVALSCSEPQEVLVGFLILSHGSGCFGPYNGVC